MRVITPAMARLLGSVRSPFLADGSDPDLIAELPPEMLRHLLREGLHREILGLLIPIPLMFFLDRAVISLLIREWQPVGFEFYFTCLGGMLLTTIVGWKSFGRGPLKREICYRRLHGKWRWEH